MSTPKLQVLGKLRGKSAYEIAVDNGFEGTEEEWLNNIENQISQEYAYAIQ